MNLTKLFEAQRELQNYKNFKYEGEDKFDKMVLALLVEVGELANEHRGFKYWSEDQEPRREKYLPLGEIEGEWRYKTVNPLLEEYSDGMHFVLLLGLDIEFDYEMWQLEGNKLKDITTQFIKLNQKITDFWDGTREHDYVDIFEMYIGLGEMLGFTWEQIEDAYFAKNKVNHERQDNGY